MKEYSYKIKNQMFNYIKSSFYPLLVLAMMFNLISCEDVIILDLKDSDPKIVIDAKLNVVEQNATVLITETTAFYESDSDAYDPAAIVSLVNEAGNTIVLDRQSAGLYTSDIVVALAGENWSLVVEIADKTYTGAALVPELVEIAKVDTIKTVFVFGGEENTFYRVFVEWNDIIDIDNYYRVQGYINDTLQTGQYFLYSDSQSNGLLMTRPYMGFFEPGQKATLELYSTDVGYYDYYLQVQSIQEQGFGGTTPFNPVGNMKDEAGEIILGNFGIVQSSRLTVQL